MSGAWRIGVLAAVLICASSALAVGDEKLTDEELQTLVNQLGARRYKARVEATDKLTEIGLGAKAVLLRNYDHAELEIRHRVRMLVEKLGIMNPDQMRAVEAKLPLMFGEKLMRVTAAKQILALGADATARLQREVLRDLTDAKIEVLPPARWTHVGKLRGARWRLRIRNVSKRPLLLPRFSRHKLGREGWRLVPSRSGRAEDEHQSGKVLLVSGKEPPGSLGNADVIAPGKSLTWTMHAPEPPEVGRWSMFLRFTPEARVAVGKGSLRFGLVDPAARDKALVRDVGYEVYAFPDWSVAKAVRGVSLTIAPGPVPQAGEWLTATVTLRNGGKTAARIDADWDRYTWVALARERGGAALVRTVREARPEAEREAPPAKRTPFALAPGKAVVVTIRLRAPVAGAYQLAAALEGARDTDDDDAEDGLDSWGYLSDRVLARAVPVRVTARK